MVAVIAGNGLGLLGTSLAQLGVVPGGQAGVGQSGTSQYVNVATGNLVLQSQDERLVVQGLLAGLVRTYNSLGTTGDYGAGGWLLGLDRRLGNLTGTLNTAGSTITRDGGDGEAEVFTYDTVRGVYVASTERGADDTLAWDGGSSTWTYIAGGSRGEETYSAAGTLTGLLDGKSGASYTLSYDAGNRLAQVTAGDGEALVLGYDADGRLDSLSTLEIPPGGGAAIASRRVTYGYDTLGRLSTVTTDLTPSDTADSSVFATTYTYDGTSLRIASLTQSDGVTVSYTYAQDSQGAYRIATVTTGSGGAAQTLGFSYDLGNRETTVTDASGRAWTYTYDAAGNLITVTSPAVNGQRQITRYTYTADGHVASMTDAQGHTTVYQYDERGNRLLERDALGNTIAYTYSTDDQLLTRTVYRMADPDGDGTAQPADPSTTWYVYDSNDRLRFVIDADGGVQETQYDARGQVSLTRTYLGAAYDTGSLSATTAPDLATIGSWAAAQDLSETTRTDYAYDTAGRLTRRTAWDRVDGAGNGVADVGASITQYVYDAQGLLRQQVTLRGADRSTRETTAYSYDGLGRLIGSTDATGATTTYAYQDAQGTLTVTYANGLVRTEVRNSAGERVTVTESAVGETSRTTTYLYDAAGQLRAVQDAGGAIRYTFYDEAGRISGTVDATGAVTRYVRDADGHVVATTQYATRIDTTGWLTGGAVTGTTPTDIAAVAPATAADDRTALAFYDDAGRHVADVDAQGNVVTYGYDGAGNAVSSTAHATALTAAQLGALQAAPEWSALQADLTSSGEDRTTYAFYDPANRKVATLDAAGYVTTIAYDAAGHVIKTVAYATGLTASQRAALGSSPSLAAVLADLSGSADDRITRSYYDDGGQPVARIDAGGYLTVTAYDATLHRVTTTRYAQALTSAQLAALTGHETVEALTGLVAGSATQARTEDYDADGRLLQATDVDGTVTTYAYDSVGHLLGTTVTPPSGGQVRSTGATYDALGDAVSRTDGANATTTATYNALGQPATSTDALGNTTWYFYDAEGRLAYTVQGQPSGSTLNALGNVTSYSYNAFGQVATTRRFAGQLTLVATGSSVGTTLNTTTATTADLASAAAALAHPATDATTTYAYTLDGQVAGVTDGRGYQIAYRYDAFGDLLQQQQQWSQPGQALGATNSVTTAYSYDARGLRTGEVDDAGGLNRTTAITYDAFGRATSRTDARGNVVTYTYDALGRQVGRSEAVQGVARTTHCTYDAYDRVLTETDAMGQVTTYAYDTAHHTVTVTTPDGIQVVTVKDAYGDTLSVTDGAGNATHYTYDGDGRLLTVQDALGNTTTTNAYDAAGHLARTTDATGHVVAYTYDAAGRTLTRTVDPDGLHLVTAYAYDGRGQQISVTDPTGTVTTYAYDAGGNVLTQVQDAGDATHLNLTTTYTWDGAGHRLSVTEGAGTASARTTNYAYDALGRRTQTVVDPGTGHLNLTTTYAYDANDNLVQVTDAAGNVTRYVYDEANERVYTLDPMGAVTQTWYDADGRVTATRAYATALSSSQLAALGSAPSPAQVAAAVVASDANDAVGYRVYDDGGKLRFVIDGMGSISETRYDAAGRVDQALAYANAIAIDATLRGKLLAGTASLSDVAAVLAQAGDGDAGARIKRTLYDAAGHVRFVLTIGDASNVAYVAERRYDAAGRVTVEVVYGEAITTYGPTLTTADVEAFVAACGNRRVTSYVYDNAGRQRYRIDAAHDVTESRYDAAGRVVETLSYANAITLPAQLTEASVAAAVTAAGTAGARIATTAYDAAGRVASTGDALGTNATYTYDAVGNRLTYTNRDGAKWTYVYDAAGRRTEEHSPSVAFVNVDATGSIATVTQSIITKLTYDALGNVASRTEAYGTGAARTTTYLYDARGRQVQTIYPDAGKIDPATGNLVAAGSTPSSQVWYDALDRAVVSLDVNNHYSYKAYDADGRLRFDVDANGNVTEYRYDAYGDQTTLIRYANTLNMSGWTAGRAFTVADVQARLNPSSQDRTLASAYDSRGNKISVQQASVSYFVGNGQYTTAGQPTTSYTYNAFGEVVRESVRVGPSTWANTYRYYDTLGRKTMDVDPMGYVTTWAYGAQGDVTQTVEYARAIATGSLSVDTPPALPAPGDASTGYDRITTYGYDAVGRKQSETRIRHYGLADGSAAVGNLVTAYTYDGEGRIVDVKVTDPRTGTTTTVAHTQYDALGRSTGLTEAARQVVVSNWQSALQTSSQTTLDSSALYRTVSPYTTFEYDALGNAIRVTRFVNGSGGTAADAGNQVTVTRYDHMGRAVDNTDAAGTHHYTAYDAAGHVVKTWYTLTDNGGQSVTVTATYTYDAAGRQLTTQVSRSGQSLPDSAQQVRYNAFGEIIAKGASTDTGIATSALPAQYVYDATGRLISAPDDKTGATHYYAYDLAGRLISDAVRISSNPNPPGDIYAITSNSLDLDGRVVTQTLPSNGDSGALGYLNKRYDRWGNVVELIDPRGYSTQYFYDDKNNLVREVQPLAKIVNASNQEVWAHPEQRWTYDALGRLIRAQDANGHVRSYTYDAAGQQVTYTDATGSITRSAYDVLGHQAAQQNAIGHITFQDFDAMDRVTAHGDFLVGSTGTTRTKSTQESYLLDQNGDRIKVTDALGHATLYGYDSQQRLLSSTTPMGVRKTYAYDVQGHKTQETTGLGSDQETWSYDYFGRVQTHTDLGGVQTTYTYSADSGLLISESNTAGGSRTTSYYANGQVKQITEGTSVYTYKYDASGNRVWEETSTTDGGGKAIHVRTQSVYDSLNRLVHVVSDDLVTGTRTLDLTYGYDGVGNRRYVNAQSGYGSNVTPISTANNNPVVAVAPTARTLRADWVGTFSLLASDIFRDPEGGVLTYGAQLQGGGALPSWLQFSYDATTGSLVFTTAAGSAAMLGQDLHIALVATDAGGLQAAADFTLRVRDNTAPQLAGVDASALTFRVKTDRDFAAELAASTYFFDEDIGDTVAIDVASISPAASWLTVDTSNPSVVRLSGHPGSSASNTYTLTLRGTDQRGATATRTITLVVAPNAAPTITPIGNMSVVGGRTLQWSTPLSSVFTDPENDPLFVSAALADGTALPPWLTFQYVSNQSPPSLVLSGQAPTSVIGSVYSITLTARDPEGATSVNTFTLSVTANVAPQPTGSIATISGRATVAFSQQISAASLFQDANGDAMSYYLTQADGSALPSWLHYSVDTSGRLTLSGTPPANDKSASYSLKLHARDIDGLEGTLAFALNVGGESAPVYNSGSINTSQAIYPGRQFTLTVPAGAFTDPDGDPLTYSASSWSITHEGDPPSTFYDYSSLPSWLTFNAATRTLSGVVPASVAVGDTFKIRISANDGIYQFNDYSGPWANTAYLTLTAEQFAGSPPVYNGGLPNRSANQGDSVSFTLPPGTFTEPDGDAMTYTAQVEIPAYTYEKWNDSHTEIVEVPHAATWVALSQAGLSIDPATGRIYGTAQTLDYDTGLGGIVRDGSYRVKIIATDPQGNANSPDAIFAFSVNQPPTAPASLSYGAGVNASFNYAVTGFSDPEGGTLVYTAKLSNGSALPAWLQLSSAGVLSGTPPTTGTWSITITAVDDHGLSSSTTLTLTSANNPPVYHAGTLTDQTAVRGAPWTYTLPSGAFTDPNGDALTYAAYQVVTTTYWDPELQRYLTDTSYNALPSWLAFNATTGTFSGVFPDSNAIQLAVVASDPAGNSTSLTAAHFWVTPVNVGPEYNGTLSDQSAQPSQAFSYTLPANSFTDANHDTLTYTAMQSGGAALPAWLSFNASTRTFSGTPTTAGTWTIVVTATDPSGANASAGFKITTANAAPTVANAIPNQTAQPSQAFSYTVPANTFNDANNDPLTYSASLSNGSALPSWLTFNASTRTFSGTGTAAGSWTIKVSATDTSGLTASTTFVITVPQVAPQYNNTLANQTAYGSQAFSYTLPANTFTDPNGGAITYSAIQNDGTALPPWLTFNTSTRTFSGTSTAVGSWVIRVIGTDPAGLTAAATFTIATPNSAPVVANAIPDQTATPGAYTYTYQVPANTFWDANGDGLTYAASMADGSALPSWMSFNAATRTVSFWAGGKGAWTLRITATDSHGAAVSTTFTIALPDVAPTYHGGYANPAWTIGQSVNLPVPAGAFTDANNDALTYSGYVYIPAHTYSTWNSTHTEPIDHDVPAQWVSLSQVGLSINAGTGTITGTASTLDYQEGWDIVRHTGYTIQVVASDPAGHSAAVNLSATVNYAPPVLVSAIPDATVNPGQGWTQVVPSGTFSDPYGHGLTLSAKLSSGAALPS
ncbi:MAG TPA: putative Ig domain-containing protein, partial [Mizugakiibacter sp.]